MKKSIEDIKKSSRGRPRANTSPIMVRVSDDELNDLDQWIAANGPPYVTRPEAIRRLIQMGLETVSSDDSALLETARERLANPGPTIRVSLEDL